MRRVLEVLILACIVLLGALVVLMLCGPTGRHSPAEMQRRRVVGLVFLLSDMGLAPHRRPLSLPRGDIRALYEWLMADPSVWGLRSHQIEPAMRDSARGVLVDVWGNPLVYRFPPRDREMMFDLYSMGPNGVDDMRDGDDITAGRIGHLPTMSVFFAGGLVDVDWIWAHLDELERDAHGNIIGAPPEKLKDVE